MPRQGALLMFFTSTASLLSDYVYDNGKCLCKKHAKVWHEFSIHNCGGNFTELLIPDTKQLKAMLEQRLEWLGVNNEATEG